MSGYHKCKHCEQWHDCNAKPQPQEGWGGCLSALAVLVIFVLLFPPCFMFIAEFWLTATCEKWPNWAKACSVNTTGLILNGDLDKRLKKLEQPKEQPTP